MDRKTKAEEMQEINAMRVELELDPIVQKNKTCLKCKQVFLAEDASSEFYCEKCKEIKKGQEKDGCYEINGTVV